MPEGPECKIVGEYLHNKLKNANCVAMIFHKNSRYIKHSLPLRFSELTYPFKILSVNVKGKLIWFEFDNGLYMLNTLGMSGMWTQTKKKHCDFEIIYTKSEVKENAKCENIFFKDMRHFGTIKFVNLDELNNKLRTIGRDVIEEEISLEEFKDLLYKRKNWTLPKFLMNQRYLSGIGNYLKSEILYLSKISPFRNISNLDNDEIKILLRNIMEIPRKSYRHQGVSIRDYTPPENYREQLDEFKLHVYGRKTDDNDYKIIRIQTSDKRTTHYVPEIQK
jgi:endonuclease VIII